MNRHHRTRQTDVKTKIRKNKTRANNKIKKSNLLTGLDLRCRTIENRTFESIWLNVAPAD